MSVTALVLNCTLKPSPAPSSGDKLSQQLLDELTRLGVEMTETLRVVDHDVTHGVEADMGDGDGWPQVRARIHAHDILILAIPTWNGQPSSVASVVYDRLNAELSDLDDRQRSPLFGKVGVVVSVGNEDGSYHVAGITYQVLTDMGVTIPAQPLLYWHGPTGGSQDYTDLAETPDNVAKVLPMLASNAFHLATALKSTPYPGVA